jgi:hypothetical protein
MTAKQAREEMTKKEAIEKKRQDDARRKAREDRNRALGTPGATGAAVVGAIDGSPGDNTGVETTQTPKIKCRHNFYQPPKRKKRVTAGIKALSEIRHYPSVQYLLLRKLPFQWLCREVIMGIHKGGEKMMMMIMMIWLPGSSHAGSM